MISSKDCRWWVKFFVVYRTILYNNKLKKKTQNTRYTQNYQKNYMCITLSDLTSIIINKKKLAPYVHYDKIVIKIFM